MGDVAAVVGDLAVVVVVPQEVMFSLYCLCSLVFHELDFT
jgi:hypothetical protein